MERLFKAIFGAITGALMSLVSIGIPIAIAMIVAAFFCNIHAEESYSWLSGIWHGIFVIPNYCRHLLYPEVLFKACDITTDTNNNMHCMLHGMFSYYCSLFSSY